MKVKMTRDVAEFVYTLLAHARLSTDNELSGNIIDAMTNLEEKLNIDGDSPVFKFKDLNVTIESFSGNKLLQTATMTNTEVVIEID